MISGYRPARNSKDQTPLVAQRAVPSPGSLPLEIPAKTMIQGLIFDCDGTLADSMPPHYVAWVETLKRYDLTLDEDLFYQLGGWPTVNVAELVIRESGRDLDPFALGHEKEAEFERCLHLVEPISPVIDIVREHHGRLPMAVATGGMRHICEKILTHLELIQLFDAIVTCDDVARHKPAPDVYLEAARRIGVPPQACKAFEDTDPGIEAARAAGMEVVDIRTLHTPRRVS